DVVRRAGLILRHQKLISINEPHQVISIAITAQNIPIGFELNPRLPRDAVKRQKTGTFQALQQFQCSVIGSIIVNNKFPDTLNTMPSKPLQHIIRLVTKNSGNGYRSLWFSEKHKTSHQNCRLNTAATAEKNPQTPASGCGCM